MASSTERRGSRFVQFQYLSFKQAHLIIGYIWRRFAKLGEEFSHFILVRAIHPDIIYITLSLPVKTRHHIQKMRKRRAKPYMLWVRVYVWIFVRHRICRSWRDMHGCWHHQPVECEQVVIRAHRYVRTRTFLYPLLIIFSACLTNRWSASSAVQGRTGAFSSNSTQLSLKAKCKQIFAVGLISIIITTLPSAFMLWWD